MNNTRRQQLQMIESFLSEKILEMQETLYLFDIVEQDRLEAWLEHEAKTSDEECDLAADRYFSSIQIKDSIY